MTVNLDQRHLASDCYAAMPPSMAGRPCGAWYTTECSWCGAEIHMHRKQHGKEAQTCSARCRVARHRADKAGA